MAAGCSSRCASRSTSASAVETASCARWCRRSLLLIAERAADPLDAAAAAHADHGGATRSASASSAPVAGSRDRPRSASVIHAFNGMQDRIHELIDERTQALAAVGHDLRTPLARLHLRLDGGRRRRAARRTRRGRRAKWSEMIASLLAFFGGDADPEKPALDRSRGDGRDAGRQCRRSRRSTRPIDGPDHLETRIRASAMRRAIANLIENALHYGERARVSRVDSR